MDLNRLNKFADSASKASSIIKARSDFINEGKNLKEGYRSRLLEARGPIAKLEEKRIQSQKKSDDERQDKLITQLQDNQGAFTTELRDIKFDRQALLDELPRTGAIEHPQYRKPPPIPPRPPGASGQRPKPWEKPKYYDIEKKKKLIKKKRKSYCLMISPAGLELLNSNEGELIQIKEKLNDINTNQTGREKKKQR